MGAVMARAPALVRALRPRQWVKNLLVFAAPLAAGVIFDRNVMRATLVALVCFIAASSATYLLNDVLDRDADRRHPDKRFRPIASGELPVQVAIGASAVLGLGAVGVPLLLDMAALAALILAYLAIQIVYFLWAKHQPVFDLAVIAGGFVLRAVAGGVAADLYISSWFLTVTAAVAMFVIAGKRYSELTTHGDTGTRRSLGAYSPGYLRFIWSVSAAVAIAFYALWASDIVTRGGGIAAQLSTVPFSLILLRYARDIDSASAESPERILLSDPSLLVLGMIWGALFVVEVLA